MGGVKISMYSERLAWQKLTHYLNINWFCWITYFLISVPGCSALILLLLPSSGNVLFDRVGDLGPGDGIGGEDVPHVRGGLPAAGDLAGRLRGTRGRPLQVHGVFLQLGILTVEFHQFFCFYFDKIGEFNCWMFPTKEILSTASGTRRATRWRDSTLSTTRTEITLTPDDVLQWHTSGGFQQDWDLKCISYISTPNPVETPLKCGTFTFTHRTFDSNSCRICNHESNAEYDLNQYVKSQIHHWYLMNRVFKLLISRHPDTRRRRCSVSSSRRLPESLLT